MRAKTQPTGPVGPGLPAPFRLIRRLGSGAMGRVFEVEHLDLGRRVAIKVMRESLLGDCDMIGRFRQEALAASRINHPHAVAVLDTGMTLEGLPFIVMECLRGRSLSALLGEQRLPAERVIAIGAQILSALHEAHTCGVIHGDLKSENVVVDSLTDGSDFAKVLDFGLARLDGDPDRPGVVAGTPEYMAPELIAGSQPTRRTDLYAMGALLHEMIVGRTPFAGGSIPTVLDRHLHDEPAPPQRLQPSCPPPLGALILRALEKAPRKRFESAAAMRAELLVAAGGSLALCAVCGEERSPDARFCGRCGVSLTGSAMPPPSPPKMRDPQAGASPSSTSSVTQTARTSRVSRLVELPVVGREDELQRVVGFLRGGTAQAALNLVGPIGIGKTSIALQAARRTAPEHTTFVVTPDPTGLARSWHPIREVLQAVLRLKARTLDELAVAVARSGLPARDLPGLAELFGLDGPLATLELAVRRREARTTALRVLRQATDWFPGCALCFIDVDRYDRPSRTLIASLAEAVDNDGPRVLCTAATPTELSPGVPILEIEGLPPEETHQLARSLVGPHPLLPAADDLHHLTGGSPAWIEQLAGWLDEGHDVASSPDSTGELIAARLSHLPSAMRLVLQAVAVLGQVVARRLVPDLIDRRCPTSAAMASLVRAGLLVLVEDDLAIPSTLVRDAVASTTPTSIRRELAARALALLGNDVTPGLAGHLAALAGDHATAATRFLAAGAGAVRSFDDDGAIQWLLRARAAALACNRPATDALIEATTRIVDVCRFTGDRTLARRLVDEAEQAIPSAPERAPLQRASARLALAEGRGAMAVDEFHRVIGLAVRAGDRRLLCEAYLELCGALTGLGELAKADVELTEAIDLLTLGEGPESAHAPPELWSVALRQAEVRLQLGHLDGARAVATAALRRAILRDDGRAMGRLHTVLARIAEAARDPVAAVQHATQAIDQLRDLGDRRSTAELLIERARQSGRLPASLASGRRAAQLAGQLAAEIGWPEGVEEARQFTA